MYKDLVTESVSFCMKLPVHVTVEYFMAFPGFVVMFVCSLLLACF